MCYFGLQMYDTPLQSADLSPLARQVGTWMHGFSFSAMPEEQLTMARNSLRILIFPGSTVLSKPLPAAPGTDAAAAASAAKVLGAATGTLL